MQRLSQVRGGEQATSDAGGSSEREADEYQRVCREIGRLLDQGRLSEARRLNVDARKLYHRLYTAQPSGAVTSIA